MARNWEETFAGWYKRASKAEEERYENTRKAINKALRGNPTLSDYTFDVYPKGSYPAFTNVVQDSDVDVAVELTTFYTPEFIYGAEGFTLEDVGGTPYTGDATLAGFKDDVHRVLTDAFGSDAVERGDKAIRIRETSSSLNADVVPCVTHKTWVSATGGPREGIALRSDKRPSRTIENYPAQHLRCGTDKNDDTYRRYKRVVRILKRLENEMVKKGHIEEVPSFLIESAVYNVRDRVFTSADTWTEGVQGVLAYIYNGTKTDDCIRSEDWLEVSRCKYLFVDGQSWTRETANNFTVRAWQYAEFG